MVITETMWNEDQIVDAYKRTGYMPAVRGWISKDNTCLCPMTLILYMKGYVTPYYCQSKDLDEVAENIFGNAFQSGFTFGYDSPDITLENALDLSFYKYLKDSGIFKDGWLHGRGVRDALIAAGYELYDLRGGE